MSNSLNQAECAALNLHRPVYGGETAPSTRLVGLSKSKHRRGRRTFLFVCLLPVFCLATPPLPRAARPPPLSEEGQGLPHCSANVSCFTSCTAWRLAGSVAGFAR